MVYICMPWFRSFGPSKAFQLFLAVTGCGCPRWKELRAWWNAGVRRGNSFKIRSKAESFAGIKFEIYQNGTLQIAEEIHFENQTSDCSCSTLPCFKVGTSWIVNSLELFSCIPSSDSVSYIGSCSRWSSTLFVVSWIGKGETREMA